MIVLTNASISPQKTSIFPVPVSLNSVLYSVPFHCREYKELKPKS